MVFLKLQWCGVLTLGLLASIGRAAQTNSLELPPAPPGFKYQEITPTLRLHTLSPVEYFRTLLGMTSAQRERLLANKPANDRNAILTKVREYEAMPADIREARLHQTELLWDIATLMKLAPAGRASRLKEISPEDRALVEDHLRQWDRLPAYLQKAFLEKESFISFYLRVQGSSAEEQQRIMDRLPPARRDDWTRELQRWQGLSQDQRQELCDRFRQLFALDDQKQQQAINGFSEGERQQMEAALQVFARLSPDQRKLCIESFQKFAVMTPQQRNEFLKNAERWQAMTARERQLWRQLVQKLPPLPPAPPGFDGDMPPIPPGMNLAKPPNSPAWNHAGVASPAPPGPLAATAQTN
jgi:hypothetical protein